MFQVSGLRVEYDGRKPIGQRVRSVAVNGEPLDPNRSYLLATNSFLAAGSGEYRVFAEGEDLEDTFLPLRDAIVAYIRRHSPVDARVEGRIVRLDR
jgi:2',3'-cyclic-nucleotide 2'-phosphodiesterase (5'-nucleotidase family)